MFELAGEQFNPNTTTVDLVKGWNWIGYPLDQTMSVAEALSLLEAEEGDFLTSLDGGYTQFANGTWNGDLLTMTPGKGYLYKSASDKSFIYNDAIVSKAKAIYSQRLETVTAPWSVNVHAYPSMMCVTAELYDDGSKVDADDYFVGAFVGDQCRGVGKSVDGRIYLSVYGGNAPQEKVNFIALSKDDSKLWYIQETLDFNADVIGSYSEPYHLNMGDVTGIRNIADGQDVKTEGIFNMLGIRVNHPGSEGVYIIHGKKVLINKLNKYEDVK